MKKFAIYGKGGIGKSTITSSLSAAFEKCKPDIVLYDVLGDVVCGGFSAPIRDGYADEVIIVTSGEKMSLFATKNICKAVKNFEDRGYATVKGVIFNRRNIENEDAFVQQFTDEYQIPILGIVPRAGEVQHYENQNMTVIEGNLESEFSKSILAIAKQLVEE